MNSKLKIAILLSSLVSFEAVASQEHLAANARRRGTQTKKVSSQSAPKSDSDLKSALNLASTGKYTEASQRLFALSYSPRYLDKRMQIKYILGLTLFQMKLYQTAAFQFIGVVKDGKSQYTKQSLEKLSLAADALGDDTLLNYAISRVNIDEFPRANRDMLHFRIGEYQARNGQHEEASRSFAKVGRGSALFSQAKYNQGLALAQGNQLDQSVLAFDELIEARKAAGLTDKSRVAAMMGRARALYQKKEFDSAIEAYRQVPRDSLYWHDTLFESSWAMLRSGRFRSALSNFHSLHSDYYEDNYQPESLLLRGIVYLYICKYDEMDKVLNLFSGTYKPVYRQIDDLLKEEKDPTRLYNGLADMIKTMKDERNKGERDEDKPRMAPAGSMPYLIAQKISREGDFQKAYRYIQKLNDERRTLNALPAAWKSSGVGQYAKRVLETRLAKARIRGGQIVRNHLEMIREELVDLFEQEGFMRYEMINGRKETLKKRIAGKEIEAQVDESNQRDFYIQNGYEYWPFQGEYWLDELGNYHYVGTQSCN